MARVYLLSERRCHACEFSKICCDLPLDSANRVELGGRMNRLFVFRNHSAACFVGGASSVSGHCCSCFSLGALAQSTSAPVVASAPIQHSGHPSPGFGKHEEQLQRDSCPFKTMRCEFQQGSKPGAQVKIASIQAVFLGGESKQVGGCADEVGQGCGSVRRWPGRQSLRS